MGSVLLLYPLLIIIRMARFYKVTNLLKCFHCPVLVRCMLCYCGLEYNTVILMLCVV